MKNRAHGFICIFAQLSVFLLPCAVGIASADRNSDTATQLERVMSQLSALTQTVEMLNKKVIEQQKTIDLLRANATQSKTRQDTLAEITAGKTNRPSGQFNPDIGIVGDIIASSTESHEDVEGNDRVAVRQVELVLGHDVDPYSRFDATIAFSDFEDASLEEAFVSYWGLPEDIKARIGRFKPKIGKASSLHRDSLDTVDEPLVVQRYLGVEGFARSGLDLSGFTPFSTEKFAQQLTVGVLEGGVGEGGTLFGETRRQATFYSRLSNFFDLAESTNAELGINYLLGSSDDDSRSEVNAVAFDTTVNVFVTPRNKLKFQSEFFLQHRKEGPIETTEASGAFNDDPWGFYALFDYRLGERWGLGARYDQVELVDAGAGNDPERAYTGYVTFYQSEFARWRLQYQRFEPVLDRNDDRIWLQGTFAIGQHKHALQ